MSLGTLVSRRSFNRGSPKTYDENRMCEVKSCSTVLSRYNKEDRCWLHSPFKRARVRGKIASEDVSGKSNVVKHCGFCSFQQNIDVKILVNGTVHVRGKNGGAICEER